MNFTAEARRRIYAVVIATLPILAAAGIALPGGQEAWLLLVAAILGVGQASVAYQNVTPDEPTETPEGPMRPLPAVTGTRDEDIVDVREYEQ